MASLALQVDSILDPERKLKWGGGTLKKKASKSSAKIKPKDPGPAARKPSVRKSKPKPAASDEEVAALEAKLSEAQTSNAELKVRPAAAAHPPNRGVFGMMNHQRGGGGPPPPPQTKGTIVGKKRNLPFGKSDWAIFGTQTFRSQTPPPPHSKDALPPTPKTGEEGVRENGSIDRTTNPLL